MMNQPQEFILPFVKKEQVALDTYTFYFSVKGRLSSGWDFTAGQYIKMMLKEENHLFTISSSPNNKDFLTITTKIRSSTFKQALFHLLVGTPVVFYGPMGNFVLQDPESEYVFLIGGIGITPLLSILRFVDEEKLRIRITALISFSSRDELIGYDFLKRIDESNSNIKVIYTVTDLKSSTDWTGETGRISEEMIKKDIVDVYNSYYYIVGPPAMVNAMIEIVEKMGVGKEKIVKENFSGY